MRSIIILRGLPGAGKTTLANVLGENNKWPIFSIDSYFIDPKTNENTTNCNHVFRSAQSARLHTIHTVGRPHAVVLAIHVAFDRSTAPQRPNRHGTRFQGPLQRQSLGRGAQRGRRVLDTTCQNI